MSEHMPKENKKVTEEKANREKQEMAELNEKFISAYDESNIDTACHYIEEMHKKGFSLNDAMYHIFNRARKEVGSGNYETNIGYLLLKYHREKNGYRHGREGENWTAPNRKKAAETLKILASLVKFANVDTNSYKIDIDYIRETIPDINKDIKNQIAYEALHDFHQDIVNRLKNDNIMEIRNVLTPIVYTSLPNDVEQYMDSIPRSEQGDFYQYYKKVMSSAKGDETNFEKAEQDYIKNASFRETLNLVRFQPKNIENMIADKFYQEYLKYSPNPDSRNMELANKIKGMTPKCQKAVIEKMAVKLAPQLDEAFNDSKAYNHQYEKTRNPIKQLLSFAIKLYDISEEETGKSAIRATLLKFRTTGSNEERREKADLYKDALKGWSTYDIQKDETIKAVSQVSYTPLSPLNRQLTKHGKEIKGR